MSRFYRFGWPQDALLHAASVILGVSGVSYYTHVVSDPACQQYLFSRGRHVLDRLLGVAIRTIYADDTQEPLLWQKLLKSIENSSRTGEAGIALYERSNVWQRYVTLERKAFTWVLTVKSRIETEVYSDRRPCTRASPGTRTELYSVSSLHTMGRSLAHISGKSFPP